LVAALIGGLLGTIVGLVPGSGPASGAASLLPLTYVFDPLTGMMLIAAMFYGIMYGGSWTSILLTIPGDPASGLPRFRGYSMAEPARVWALPLLLRLSVVPVAWWCSVWWRNPLLRLRWYLVRPNILL